MTGRALFVSAGLGFASALLAVPQTQAQQAPAGAAPQDQPQSQLEEIVVTADRKNSFGAQYVQAGTFRGARLLDTPLSVTVVPRDLIEAQQAVQLEDVLRNVAGVTFSQIGGSVYSNLAIRGIVVENRGNYRMDSSLPVVNLIDTPIEDKERVEALKGVSALYYGFTTPSGIINFVMKRPTPEDLTTVTLFGNSHGSIGGAADISRQIVPDKVGVRLNVVDSTTESGIDLTSGDRQLVTAAVDIAPIEDVHSRSTVEWIRKKIVEPNFYSVPVVGGRQVVPDAPDPSKNLGSSTSFYTAYEVNLLQHVDWRFDPDWELMFEAGESHLDRDRYSPQFAWTNLATGAGTLSETLTHGNEYRNENYRAELSGAIETGPAVHQLTFGFTRNIRKATTTTNPSVSFAQNFFNPVTIPYVPLPVKLPGTTSRIDDKGYYIFDRIKIDPYVEVLVGVRRTIYADTSTATAYPSQKQTPGKISANATSPSGGVVVKPYEWLSLYGTYIQGLEEIANAPLTVKNPGATLGAAPTEQYELGVKSELLDGLQADLAYFHIERVNAFTDATNTYVANGRLVYKGFEGQLTGEITPDISVFATFQWEKTRQEQTVATQIGLQTENAPPWTLSVTGRYKVPELEGLALEAGVFYVGGRNTAQTALTARVPGYVTLDLGATYQVPIYGVDTTLRLYAENVTQAQYWASTGSSLLASNVPPTVKFSITASF